MMFEAAGTGLGRRMLGKGRRGACRDKIALAGKAISRSARAVAGQD